MDYKVNIIVKRDDFGNPFTWGCVWLKELGGGALVELTTDEGTDKLLKLQIDCGDKRQIVAGVAKWYTPEEITGKTIIVVANLKPATLCGVESAGMLLAAKTKKELRLLTLDGEMPTGTRIG